MTNTLVVYVERSLDKVIEILSGFDVEYLDIHIVDYFDFNLVKRKNKTYVLISASEILCTEWERVGGKAIKYSTERVEKYQGLVFKQNDSAEKLRRLLNIY